MADREWTQEEKDAFRLKLREEWAEAERVADAFVLRYPRLFALCPLVSLGEGHAGQWEGSWIGCWLPVGWTGLADGLAGAMEAELEAEPDIRLVAVQLKEKFSRLKLYLDRTDADGVPVAWARRDEVPGTPEGEAAWERWQVLVSEATRKSLHTCQECGADGAVLRQEGGCGRGGLVATLCDTHAPADRGWEAFPEGSPMRRNE